MAGSNKNNSEEILRVKGLTHLDVGNEINLVSFMAGSLPKNTARFQCFVSLSDQELFREGFLLMTVTVI